MGVRYCAPLKALVFDLSVPRYVAAVATRRKIPALVYGKLSCLSLRDVAKPELPGADWVRLRPRAAGLCGTDMSNIFLKTSPLLSVFASSPSVLGHEIVADVIEVPAGFRGSVREGDRVAVDPVLSCATRGMPACRRCDVGAYGTCLRHGDGRGALLGYSNEHPGGFAEELVAHESQLFPLSKSVDDDRGVLTEPTAVAVHAVLAHRPEEAGNVLVIGGGIIAFAVLFALKELFPRARVSLYATEGYQRDIASSLGADAALGGGAERDLLALAAADLGVPTMKPMIGRGMLAGGYDAVFDCIGSKESLDDAIRVIGPGGKLVLVGAAGQIPSIDLTPIWTKEVELEGTVYYGHEEWRGVRRRTFDLTRELLEGTARPYGSLVTHRFPLDRYADAIGVNLDRRGTKSVKAVLHP